MSFPKFPKSAVPILTPLILSFCMTFIVSAVSLIRSLGFTAAMLHAWPTAWLASWVIAFPAVLIILPLTRKIVGKITA